MVLSEQSSTKIGDFLLEGSFEVAALLAGPSELRCHSHLSFGTDEDIQWTDVADPQSSRVESVCGLDDRVDEVPEFAFLEELGLHVAAIDDLIAQQIGVVFVGYLSLSFFTVATPPLPQNSVFWKRCCSGRNKFSPSPTSATRFCHRLNSFSLGRGTVISTMPSSSSVGGATTLSVVKRGWLMVSGSASFWLDLACEGAGPIYNNF